MPPNLLSPFVHLPKDHPPNLPEKCVRCGSADPLHGVTLWATSSNLLSFIPFIGLLATRAVRVTFPACRSCAWRIRIRRLGSFTLMAGAISAAMFAADRWTATWPRLAHHLSIPGAMLVAILLVAGLEATFRPAVELTLQGDKVEYYFHNAEFCTAFKLRNLAAMNR